MVNLHVCVIQFQLLVLEQDGIAENGHDEIMKNHENVLIQHILCFYVSKLRIEVV